MARNGAYQNHKGFFHHPDTPSEDKALYIQNQDKAIALLRLGTAFLEGGVVEHRSIPCDRAELCVNSRYLHRGYYCPSPVLDLLVTNTRRGRILKRPTERSNITNRYAYDTSGRLIYTDNFINGKMVSSEYVKYHENLVYGITIGMSGRIICISEERYANSRIVSYQCAYYSGAGESTICYRMDCENYQYDEEGLAYWDHGQIYFGWEQAGADGFIQHNRYSFLRENGWLKAFVRVQTDGTPMDENVLNEIKIKRKA